MLNKIKEEHINIRENVKLVGDSVNDREALNALSGTRNDWIPDKTEIFSEKQKRLQQTLSFLGDGLRNHFALEIDYLTSFLDEPFMRALILEHHDILKQLGEAKLMAADIKLDGLGQDELISKEAQIQQTISKLGQAIIEHAIREETLLGMLEKGLNDRAAECENEEDKLCI